MLFNPRGKVETYASQFIRFCHPYIAFITYRFHVEKAREAGKYLFLLDFYLDVQGINMIY